MFDEAERKLIAAINYYLTCGPLNWDEIGVREYDGFIKFKIMKNETIELKIELFYNDKNELRTIVWEKDCTTDDDDWGWPIYAEHTTPVPETEEEYFQYSTVYNLVYTFEFFNYIKSVLTYGKRTENVVQYHN